jgi:tetratricopeptide (TPR) repeat protein
MPASNSLADGRQDGGASPPGGKGGASTSGGGGGTSPSGGRRRDSLTSLGGALAGDPAAVPALAALALIIAWAADQAGYPQTHWAPGGVILLTLLAIAIGAGGAHLASAPRAVRIAIVAFAAYTALSFLSILWARVPADAWEGADRTLLYLIVFALFAIPRRAGSVAALLLCLWALAMAGLAAFTVLHVNAAAGQAASLQRIMPGGRLIFPAGYTNANAALWMIAFFPAWILASARGLPGRAGWVGRVGPIIRGLLAGGAVILAATALYSQSRGSVFSTPLAIALVFLLLPGRVRSFATLLPIAAGVAVCAPAVLRLAERVESGSPALSDAHAATLSVLAAAAAVAALVAIAATVERRSRISSRGQARLQRGLAIAGILTALGLIAGGLVAVGDPIARAKHEWSTFASQHGYAANETGKSRLISGLGSGRADFYRVAWHELASHPLLGIGADNFAAPYLRLRRTDETPHYPHSVELRTLAETGAVGAAIALIGLVAALLAGSRALRAQDRLARTVAAAALAGFGYWAIHGSFDWFFEYAGLGAAAFALLGLSCSLAPATGPRGLAAGGGAWPEPAVGVPTPAASPVAPRPPAAGGGAAAAAGTSPSGGGRGLWALRVTLAIGALALALAAGAALTLPWLSRMEVESAARAWTLSPTVAYDRLAEASRLDPLSDEPNLVAGTIALRLGELRRAKRQFGLALDRNPEGEYATLELGVIASDLGGRARALALLRRAALLDPRSPQARWALAAVRRGARVNIAELNRSILREAQHLS